MNLTPVKTPVVVKKMFPNYVWDISTSTREIYLTFDDGPTPEITEWTLQTLEQFKAKATFFCVGKNVKENPEIFNSILQAGHSIGNHTHDHIKGWNTSKADYLKNIEKASKFINSELFRPPYGQIKPKQGKEILALGYKIIMWNVLSFDWDESVSENQCMDNVISKVQKGSIVVFHDSVKASRNLKFALPKVLEYFSERGFEFKSL